MFARAFGVRHRYTLYFGLKRPKNATVSVRAFAAPKMVDLLHDAQKTCQLFKLLVVLRPLKKNSAGAHVKIHHFFTVRNVERA